jgi:predicted GH43/DUF377 family glycosyl hydrolase
VISIGNAFGGEKLAQNKIWPLVIALIMISQMIITLESREAVAVASSPVKWIKYNNNPVLSPGPSGSWDGTTIYSSFVMQVGNELWLYYMGGDGTNQRIGLAKSTDGRSWTKYNSNPIMDVGDSGNWDSTVVSMPYIVKDGSTYMMWYHGSDGTTLRIGHATSQDGINWTKFSDNPVLDVGSLGSWEDTHVTFPYVIKDGDEYRMWYIGYHGNVQNIGYASSTDGTNWTKYADNPVLVQGANNEWDDTSVSSPQVFNISGTLRMWYSGYNGNNWCIGTATSSDGLSWTRYANNPVLSPEGNGWEAHDVMLPVVLYNGSTYRMWYTGVDSSWNTKFGYAEGWNTVPDAPALTAPSDDIWTNNNQPIFTWTFSDPNSQDAQTAYQVQLDDMKDFSSVDYETGKVSSTATSYTPSSALADGIYFWRAKVWDSDDDSSSWSTVRTINIDTTPPGNPTSLTSTSHTTGTWSNDNTIDVSFSGASDLLSGIGGFSVVWDNSSTTIPDTVADLAGDATSQTSPNMSDSDSIYFHIRAIDSAGNAAAGAISLGPFYIDTTPPTNPTVTSSTHTTGVWSNLSICEVNWTGADGSISGLDGYSYIWDNIPATVPDAIQNCNASVINLSSPGLADGTWYFHIRSLDQAGNWATGAAHFGPLEVDATPPFNPLDIASSHVPSQWSNDDTVDVQWSGFNGAICGVAGFSYDWDTNPDTVPDASVVCNESVTSATSPDLADGASHYFHIRTVDNAGNWNASAVHFGPLWIDSTPPANVVALTSGSHSLRKWSNDTTIDFSWSTAADGGLISGYDGFSILWDMSDSTVPGSTVNLNATTTSCTSPLMPDSDSIYFHIRARDRAGNWAPDAVHLGPFWIDSSPPKNPLVVQSPSHKIQNWSADNTVEMNWSDADASISGVDGYSYAWDTSPLMLPPDSINVSADTLNATSPSLSDGKSWYFHLRTSDRAGNFARDAVHLGPFFIDITPPNITQLSIDNGAASVSDPLASLAFSALDPAPGSGIADMRFSLDGSQWTAWEPFAYAKTLNLTGPDGERSVYIQVRDKVGNFQSATVAEILLDTHLPSNVSLHINGGTAYSNSSAVTLTVNATDYEPGSGLAAMAFSFDNVKWDAWENFAPQKNMTLLSGDGKRTVFVKVRDGVGNIGQIAEGDIQVDTATPQALAIVINSMADVTNNLTVRLTLSASDPNPSSGLGEMSFSADGIQWTPWEPYATSRNYTFPGDGTQSIHFRVRDRAINMPAPVSASILVDTSLPKILTITVTHAGQKNATIAVITDEPCKLVLDYGTGKTYKYSVGWDNFTTDHVFELAKLGAGTTYHYKITATDRGGNPATVSADQKFSTKAESKTPVGALPLVAVLAVAMLLMRRRRGRQER